MTDLCVRGCSESAQADSRSCAAYSAPATANAESGPIRATTAWTAAEAVLRRDYPRPMLGMRTRCGVKIAGRNNGSKGPRPVVRGAARTTDRDGFESARCERSCGLHFPGNDSRIPVGSFPAAWGPALARRSPSWRLPSGARRMSGCRDLRRWGPRRSRAGSVRSGPARCSGP